MVVSKTLDELVVPDKRLGRHVEHDPRSRDYAFEAPAGITYKSVMHHRYGPVFDQGQLGSCTGNACAGVINTMPVHDTTKPVLKESDALDLYELATHLDSYPGAYPPHDTGSSGLAVAKAAKQKGYITNYKHAFSIDAALAAIQTRPVITGVVWYEGFDTPDDGGLVKISGQIRGGHEFEIKGFQLGLAIMDSLIICENSWGLSYSERGIFSFTVATFQKLLEHQGDVTILFR